MPAPQGRASLRARAALAWLLLALVLVPALGRLHQVMHAKVLPGMQAHMQGGAQQVPGLVPPASAPLTDARAMASRSSAHGHHAHPVSTHSHGLLNLLLADHAPVDCLLLDQLALGDALHSASTALAALVPAQALVAPPAQRAAARHVAHFHARGPPVAA